MARHASKAHSGGPARNGRVIQISICLLLIGGFIEVFPSPPAVRAQPGGVMFGSSAPQRGNESPADAVRQIEAEIGRTLDAVRIFKRWDSAFPTEHDRWLRNTGHTLYLSIAAQRLDGSRVPWTFIESAQPDWHVYQEMVHWANKIQDFGSLVYVLFDPEPETSSLDVMGARSDFIGAWRKVVDVFRQVGVSNVRFVWDLTAYTFGRADDSVNANAWYPGDEYVDGIGADGYNFAGCRPGVSDVWRSFSDVFEPVREFGQAHPTKFLAIPEWGSVEDPNDPGRKAQWITDAAATLKSPGWEQFQAILYWHSQSPTTPPCKFWFDSSESSLNAFAAMGADPYFLGSGGPVIDSFLPTGGRAGKVVTLTGSNFTSVLSVRFNGLDSDYVVLDPAHIAATVPLGATAGPIEVTTEAGSAAGHDDFSVVHSRHVSLKLDRHLVARGLVRARDGFDHCAAQVPAKIRWKPRRGTWRPIARISTRSNGSFRIRLDTGPGRYDVRLPRMRLPSGDICGRSRSRTRVHHA